MLFFMEIMENYPKIIPVTPSSLEHWDNGDNLTIVLLLLCTENQNAYLHIITHHLAFIQNT